MVQCRKGLRQGGEMIDELNKALDVFRGKWDELIEGRKNRAFFKRLKPTAVGWKTTDLAEFDQRFAALRGLSDQVHLGWMNDRWIAIFHLKEEELAWGVSLVKLMQRRPNSTDKVGLD